MARVHTQAKGWRPTHPKAAALFRAVEQGFLRRLEDRLSYQQSRCPRRAGRQREQLVSKRRACFDGQLKPGSLARHRRGSAGLNPGWLSVFDFVVEALTESFGHLVFDTITDQLHDVLGPVQDCRTVGANLEMRFHAAGATWPYQGLTFSYSCFPEYQLPSIPGAKASRIWKRARRSLVLTLPSVMPSACAVSWMLRCWTSLSISTSRYFVGREFKARCRASLNSFRWRVSDGISRQSA